MNTIHTQDIKAHAAHIAAADIFHEVRETHRLRRFGARLPTL